MKHQTCIWESRQTVGAAPTAIGFLFLADQHMPMLLASPMRVQERRRASTATAGSRGKMHRMFPLLARVCVHVRRCLLFYACGALREAIARSFAGKMLGEKCP